MPRIYGVGEFQTRQQRLDRLETLANAERSKLLNLFNQEADKAVQDIGRAQGLHDRFRPPPIPPEISGIPSARPVPTEISEIPAFRLTERPDGSETLFKAFGSRGGGNFLSRLGNVAEVVPKVA